MAIKLNVFFIVRPGARNVLFDSCVCVEDRLFRRTQSFRSSRPGLATGRPGVLRVAGVTVIGAVGVGIILGVGMGVRAGPFAFKGRAGVAALER